MSAQALGNVRAGACGNSARAEGQDTDRLARRPGDMRPADELRSDWSKAHRAADLLPVCYDGGSLAGHVPGVYACSYGFPHEFGHFADCVASDPQPLETGEDGRAMLEIIYAACQSARTGSQITLPFTPPAWAHGPLHCWKPWLSPDCPVELKMADQ